MTHNSELRYEIRNYTIWTLYQMYKDGRLSLENDFSRGFFWENKEKAEFIGNVLRNIPCSIP